MTLDTGSRIARGAGIVVVLAALTTSCGDVNGALRHESEAKRLSGDLILAFTRATDASNRAVMADSDASSVAFAREADDAKLAVQKDVDALGPILQQLRFAGESSLLQQFAAGFAEYTKLDRRILDLAVEGTNLKAQRISFGPARTEADALRDALDAVVPSAAKDAWRVKALAATAVASVREIQALQAPHIADLDDAVMTSLEERMSAAEKTARTALAGLQPLVDSRSRPRLATAAGALDRFMSLNAQIIALSRRNTNLRSLALSLNEKQKLIAPCNDTLRGLRDALAKHGYPPGRVPAPSSS